MYIHLKNINPSFKIHKIKASNFEFWLKKVKFVTMSYSPAIAVVRHVDCALNARCGVIRHAKFERSKKKSIHKFRPNIFLIVL